MFDKVEGLEELVEIKEYKEDIVRDASNCKAYEPYGVYRDYVEGRRVSYKYGIKDYRWYDYDRRNLKNEITRNNSRRKFLYVPQDHYQSNVPIRKSLIKHIRKIIVEKSEGFSMPLNLGTIQIVGNLGTMRDYKKTREARERIPLYSYITDGFIYRTVYKPNVIDGEYTKPTRKSYFCLSFRSYDILKGMIFERIKSNKFYHYLRLS